MTLQELLGDAYKDGMSLEDIDSALKDKKLVDTAKGEYVPLDKFLETEKKMKALTKENAELMKKQKGAGEERETEKNEYLERISQLQREVNKGRVEGVLKGAGLTEEDYKDFIDSFVGDDAETSENMAKTFAAAMTKKIDSAKKDAESALKAKYLKEGVRLPDTGGGQDEEGAIGKRLAKAAAEQSGSAVDDIKKQYA